MLKYRILSYVGQATYGGEVHTLFWWRNTERKKPLGIPGHIGEVNMKRVLKKRWEDVDLIGLGQNRDKWGALVNAVMNL